MSVPRGTERGYCGIGIVSSKTPANVGTLWRSAALMGAAFIFTVGRRFPHQASDTIKAWRHVPYFEVTSIDELPTPKDCLLVGVEQTEGAEPLPTFRHPERPLPERRGCRLDRPLRPEREGMSACVFCREPLQIFSTIRPGGLPFYWRDCTCDEAEIARPLWPLRIETFEDVLTAASILPDSTYVLLSRVLAA